jgi:mannobiose 2-epimerase
MRVPAWLWDAYRHGRRSASWLATRPGIGRLIAAAGFAWHRQASPPALRAQCPRARNVAIDPAARLACLVPQFEYALERNVLDFWYPQCLDRRGGGYFLNFGPRGEPRAASTKMVVTQSRMVWFFSRMAGAGYRTDELLAAADWGFVFLRDRMWDAAHDGFYWELSGDGTSVVNPDKVTYGHAFALYALAEYFLVSGNREALELAVRVYDLLDARARDRSAGGYVDGFTRNWTPKPTPDHRYDRPVWKSFNTHVHLLEAMTTFCRTERVPAARERLIELIDIQSRVVVRDSPATGTDAYDRNWQPIAEDGHLRSNYGHDLENIWLLMRACDAAAVPVQPLGDLFQRLFTNALSCGYDDRRGGFCLGGRIGERADYRQKVWWVQAEALVSALSMHQFTRDVAFLDVFEQTWGFLKRYQIDWKHGEWHREVTWYGRQRGEKADPWKAAYHTGRALLECLQMARQLGAGTRAAV